jgi:hypothetical protein
MDQTLQHMVELSFKLNDDLAQLIYDAQLPSDRRGQLATAMCQVAIGHGNGQRLLIMTDHVVTALALVRVQFEALIRATWMLHGATDDWLERFVTPKAPEDLGETVMGPKVESMLTAIDGAAPPFVGKMLREFKTTTWKPMNSFVHGGVHAVVNAMVDTPPEKFVSLLRNANGMSFLAGQVLVIASRDASLAGRIRRMQLANLEALPPMVSP